MDFWEVIEGRESVRDYDPDRPIDKTLILRILEAGRIAPSAANLQPWRFIVVSSPEKLEEVRKCYPGAWFHEAPHILVVTGRPKDAWKRKDGYNSIETDLTIALDHIVLAAESLGVGTCWVEAYDEPTLRKATGMTDDEKVFSITPMGYPRVGYQKRRIKPRKPLEDITRFI
jgi:nitroreductase